MIRGLHIKQTKKMGDKSSVPIIEHEGRFIQGSTEIINYLDLPFSDKPLTPKDERLKKKF